MGMDVTLKITDQMHTMARCVDSNGTVVESSQLEVSPHLQDTGTARDVQAHLAEKEGQNATSA
jgi:hypothetical protein